MIMVIHDKETRLYLIKPAVLYPASILPSMQQSGLPVINILLWVSIHVLVLPLLTEHTATQLARWHSLLMRGSYFAFFKNLLTSSAEAEWAHAGEMRTTPKRIILSCLCHWEPLLEQLLQGFLRQKTMGVDGAFLFQCSEDPADQSHEQLNHKHPEWSLSI